MILSSSSLSSLTYIRHIILVFVFILNFMTYRFTKLIKKNEKCLKKNGCTLSYSSRKILLIKNLTFFMNCFILINMIVPFNKYISKIPIISGFYNLLNLILIIILVSFLKKIITILERDNCLTCLGITNKSISYIIIQLFLKFKGKSSLLLIGIYYICLIYLL